MKRLVLLLSLVLVFAMAVPVVAGPFSDVPESHWAYDAIQKVADAGIIGGYPDGTFKGEKTVSRYEMAVVITRILNQVAEEREALAEKVDALEGGLTAGQAEDTIAIFKSLIRKHENNADHGAIAPTTNDGLTEKEAEEVAGIVEALVMEFKFELEDLGADISAIEDRLTDVEGRVDALEADQDNFNWRGTYAVDVNRTAVEENTAYENPFNMTNDDGAVAYENKEDINHSLTLGFDVATDNLEASFDIATSTSDFIKATDAGGFKVEDLFATISNEDITATIGKNQAVNMAPYLFGNADAESYDGIIVEHGSDKYVLVRDWAYYTDVDGNYTEADGTVLDEDADPILNEDSIKNVIAAQRALGIMDSTLYVGLEDVVENNNFVVGLDIPFNVIDADIDTDLAMQKIGEDYYKYFTIEAAKTMGMFDLTADFTLNDDEFVGIMDTNLNEAGFGMRADIDFNENISANARFQAKDLDKIGFGAEATLGKLELFADNESVTNADDEEATRTQFTADYETVVNVLDITAGYNYDKIEDAFSNYLDDDDDPLKSYHRATGTVEAALPANLTATGNYVYSVADFDAAGDTGLTTHNYDVEYGEEGDLFTAGMHYEMVEGNAHNVHADLNYSILTAGVVKEFGASDTLTANATVDPEAYEVYNVSIDTIAGFKMENNDETLYNYNVGVDASKDINEKSDLTYGFVYDNRGIRGDDALAGLEKKHTVAYNYEFIKDLNVEVSYTSLAFEGTDLEEADSSTDDNPVFEEVNADYTAKELTAGISLDF